MPLAAVRQPAFSPWKVDKMNGNSGERMAQDKSLGACNIFDLRDMALARVFTDSALRRHTAPRAGLKLLDTARAAAEG
jgi:hypothetical protein